MFVLVRLVIKIYYYHWLIAQSAYALIRLSCLLACFSFILQCICDAISHSTISIECIRIKINGRFNKQNRLLCKCKASSLWAFALILPPVLIFGQFTLYWHPDTAHSVTLYWNASCFSSYSWCVDLIYIHDRIESVADVMLSKAFKRWEDMVLSRREDFLRKKRRSSNTLAFLPAMYLFLPKHWLFRSCFIVLVRFESVTNKRIPIIWFGYNDWLTIVNRIRWCLYSLG